MLGTRPTSRPIAERPRWARVLRVAVVLLVAASGLVLSRSSWFHVRRIEIAGADHLSRGQVLEIAGISRSANALWLDEGGAEDRLEAHAWVARADIQVILPVTVRISVVERTPVAVASDGLYEVLLATDGTSLGTGAAIEAAPRTSGGLPHIDLLPAGTVDGAAPDPASAARAIGAMTPALRDVVKNVSVKLDGTLVLTLRGGGTVLFGSTGQPGAKARAIERMLAWADAEGERIIRLSVIAPTAPAVIFAD
jgi:cell division protein FtsQ